MKKVLAACAMLIVLIILALLDAVPIYSTSANGCMEKAVTLRRSIIIGGNSKSSIDREAEALIEASSKYDCPVNKVTYKLYIL
jgi:hypothetical protein